MFKKNIVIVGFMGTGKTTVAGLIAARLGMEYVSTDDIVITQAGMAVNEIFSKKGEPYFRKLEKQAVARASEKENVVIDCGGGAVMDKLNVSNLKKKGALFCLNAPADEILRRTGGYTHRPLLNVPEPSKEINRILQSRAEYYKRADYQIDTGYKSAEKVAEEIISAYRSLCQK